MATTISSYSVSLALDARDYIRNSDLSRAETNRLVREINGARTPADNYARSLGLLDKSLKQGAIDQNVYNRLVDAAGDKMHKASNAASGLSNSLARMVAAYVGFTAIKGFIADSASLAMQAESASIQFEVLTGTIEESQDLLRGLKELAATTPLSFSNTQEAAKTLLAFNVETQMILPTLKMLGDITGGNSERFKMLSLAFAQMSSAGRLMGQDLLQMINAGFNPLQEISRKTGESMIELKKRMEAGGVSAQEVSSAFQSATAEGGRFFGMIDRMGETTEGRLAILKDSVDDLKRSLGELATADAAQAQVEGATKSVSAFTKGLNALTSGDIQLGEMGKIISGMTSKTEQDALKAIEQQNKFMEMQVALRRANMQPGQTAGSRSSGISSANQAAKEQIVAGDAGLSSAIEGGLDSIRSGAGGLMDLLTATREGALGIAMAGMANTQELIKSTKDDPAIAALEVGTQEAYAYLTQASRDAEKQARDEASKKAQLEENAKKQRDQMVIWLDRINTSLENNGFKRFR